MSGNETFDVVVVGSGSAGAMAALRAAEHGLSVLIIEKAHKFGGTSATSGGVIWIPNHQLVPSDDSREKASPVRHLNVGHDALRWLAVGVEARSSRSMASHAVRTPSSVRRMPATRAAASAYEVSEVRRRSASATRDAR